MLINIAKYDIIDGEKVLSKINRNKIEIGKVICFKELGFFNKKYIGEIILMDKEKGWMTIKKLNKKFKTTNVLHIDIMYCDNYRNV